MSSLAILRKLAEYQHYTELLQMCETLWRELQQPAVLPLLALAHACLGAEPQAEQVLERLTQDQHHLDALSRMDLAAALIALQRVDEAIPLLQQALDECPLHAIGLARMGCCFVTQGNLVAARSSFEQAVQQAPEQPAILAHLVRVALKQSDYPLAQRVIEQAFSAIDVIRSKGDEAIYHHFYPLFFSLQLELWVAREEFAFAEVWLEDHFDQIALGNNDATHWCYWLEQYGQLLLQSGRGHQATELLHNYAMRCPSASAIILPLVKQTRQQGSSLFATRLLQGALERDQHNSALWAELALSSLPFSLGQARQAAEQAIEIAAGGSVRGDICDGGNDDCRAWAQAVNSLAHVELCDKEFETAERLFLTILEQCEGFSPALHGLLLLRLNQGNFDTALTLFKSLDCDLCADDLSSFNSVDLLKQRMFLRQLEAFSQSAEVTGALQTKLLFLLAAAWQQVGHHDQAFELVEQANAMRRLDSSYLAADHRRRCARIRARFDAALFDQRATYGVDSELPVFVVGMPCSGLSLVEQLLATHSQVGGAGQLGLIPQLREKLNRLERRVGSNRSYPDCVDDLPKELVSTIANRLLKQLQDCDPQAKRIIDRRPHNFEEIGLIKLLFPNAKIISVCRDPRNIGLANYFTDYSPYQQDMGFASDLSAIGEQLADHNLLMRHWQQLFPGQILEINYEYLVENVETVCRKMFEYIGLEWQPQQLDLTSLSIPNTVTIQTAKSPWTHYQKHLKRLLQGTNTPILPEVQAPMITLPDAGFLTRGVTLYQQGDIDGAELSFKKMLQFNPAHAACLYMLGLVSLRKGHLRVGIVLLKNAVANAPWKKEWQTTLEKAYQLMDSKCKINELQKDDASVNQGENLFENESLIGCELSFSRK